MDKTYHLSNERQIRLVQGDITTIAADAIVNAANAQLMGGGGVDGAIHRAGGPALMAELNAIRPQVAPLPSGGVVPTTAGDLPARFVFHTAGPVYRSGRHGEPEALAACYRNSLDLSEQHELKTISFPGISTGAYGYPAADAAHIAIGEVVRFLESRARSLETVIFVQFSPAAFQIYRLLLDATVRP